MQKLIHVLAISYGRHLFDAENSERLRMERCAEGTASYHMIIFTLRKDGCDSVLSDSGLVLHPTNSKSKVHMIKDAILLGLRIIRTESSKSWVVTSQDPFESGFVGYVIARLSGKAFNVQEHNDFFSTPHWRKDAVFNRIRFVVGKFILKHADTVRVVSRRVVQTMKTFDIPAHRIVYLPVRTDSISSSKSEKVDLHTQYPDASVIVVSMGRLVTQKNIPLLIRAFKQLKTVESKALLLIVGSGNEEHKLQSLVQKLQLRDSVIFLPWTDNPYGFMLGADVFTLSSNWEGWGRVLIEAISAGTLAVTTDVGCAGEIFIDGKHGAVVSVGDEKKFAEKLITLAQDEHLRNEYKSCAVHNKQHPQVSETQYVSAWVKVFENTYAVKNT